MPPRVTADRRPCRRHRRGGPSRRTGPQPRPGRTDLAAVVAVAVVAVGHQHALGEEVLERLVVLDEAEIAHHLRPEAGVEQMEHGVLDAADVLVHRHPIVGALVDHGRGAVGRAVALEVPGAVDEGVHRVGFALGVAAALRDLTLRKDSHLVSGLPEPSGIRSSGSTTGRSCSGTGTGPQHGQLIIGIGCPSSAGGRCPSRADGIGPVCRRGRGP